MNEEDALKYLEKKAPQIAWSIEDGEWPAYGGRTQKGRVLRGTIVVNGEELSDTIPLTFNDLMLDFIAEGFIADYERKTNGTA